MARKVSRDMAIYAGMCLLILPGCSGGKWFSSSSDAEYAQHDRPTQITGLGESVQSTGSASDDGGSSREMVTGDGFKHDTPVLSMVGPGVSPETVDGGILRGLDRLGPGQELSEERVREGAISSRMLTTAGEQSDRRLAELRREEEAAIEAGLRDAFFGFDLWSISNETMMGLSANADWIKRNPRAQVRISGHCDERGTNDYNVVLGEKRAKAVKRVLSDLGVNPTQVSILSFGKNRPFCSEHNESCYQQNRRGHFFLSMK
ncbi:MAG: OmpA family protein [Nitrospiraceae bacterium]